MQSVQVISTGIPPILVQNDRFYLEVDNVTKDGSRKRRRVGQSQRHMMMCLTLLGWQCSSIG
jgi:hypothetical protein